MGGEKMERSIIESQLHTIKSEPDRVATTAEWKRASDTLSAALESIEALLEKKQAATRNREDRRAGATWLRDWVKLESYSERIAGSLAILGCACFEDESPDNDDKIIASAWKLFDYFKRHTRSLATAGDISLKEIHVSRAVAWISRQPRNANGEIVVSTRDVQSHHVGSVRKAEDARRLFRELARRGHGVVRTGQRGRSLVFVLSDHSLNTQHSQRSP
jgi:hypothetical protein